MIGHVTTKQVKRKQRLQIRTEGIFQNPRYKRPAEIPKEVTPSVNRKYGLPVFRPVGLPVYG